MGCRKRATKRVRINKWQKEIEKDVLLIYLMVLLIGESMGFSFSGPFCDLVEFTGGGVRAENRSLSAGAWLFVGWMLHYLPFWAMGRVLYFHHYFPALIFNSLLSGKWNLLIFIQSHEGEVNRK